MCGDASEFEKLIFFWTLGVVVICAHVKVDLFLDFDGFLSVVAGWCRTLTSAKSDLFLDFCVDHL